VPEAPDTFFLHGIFLGIVCHLYIDCQTVALAQNLMIL
jgi:hypothetical protein